MARTCWRFEKMRHDATVCMLTHESCTDLTVYQLANPVATSFTQKSPTFFPEAECAVAAGVESRFLAFVLAEGCSTVSPTNLRNMVGTGSHFLMANSTSLCHDKENRNSGPAVSRPKPRPLDAPFWPTHITQEIDRTTRRIRVQTSARIK